jgi:hypothetical protein
VPFLWIEQNGTMDAGQFLIGDFCGYPPFWIPPTADYFISNWDDASAFRSAIAWKCGKACADDVRAFWRCSGDFEGGPENRAAFEKSYRTPF